MSTLIKKGSRVTCPRTDDEGCISFAVGVLTSINSRYATVEFSDGTSVKVGKTKVELIEESTDDKSSGRKSLGEYGYEPVRAASGRKSLDKGDDVALRLRGLELNAVYSIAAKELDETAKSLKAKYEHLNPGQQRMCLGNRLRKA